MENNQQQDDKEEIEIEKIEERKKTLTKNTKLITEQLLYLNLLKNHHKVMFCLLILHAITIVFFLIKVFFSSKVEQSSFFCNNAQNIKNIVYLIFNIILLLYCRESMKRKKAMLSNINFMEKTRIFLVFGILMSFAIFFFKFIPDFCCRNISLNLWECFLMSFHIFFENCLLFFYIKWFVENLKNFGMLIN